MDSPATSPRSDTSARSRTRSATTVVSVSVGEVEESPTLLPPGSPELVWERALVPYSDGISSPLDLEDAGRREQRAIVLDMCYAHLVRRGFGVLELASLRLEESEDIGYQVAEELNLQYEQYIGDSVYLWLQEAKEGARIVRRTTGYLAGAIAWMDLGRRPAIEGIDDPDDSEPPPPKGERQKRLLDEGSLAQAREERLQDLWASKLREELVESKAPVIDKLAGSLDPERAVLLLGGKTRASTLKRYVTIYGRWRIWLRGAKARDPPGSPADLADYLLARGDEPCGRTVPEAILKAVAWMEKVAEFPLEDRATFGRIATAIKDTVVERLSWKAPFTKRAPRYPAAILVRFERIVRNRVVPVGWRIWAWAKLVKTWASLRWSDLQAMISGISALPLKGYIPCSAARRPPGLLDG